MNLPNTQKFRISDIQKQKGKKLFYKKGDFCNFEQFTKNLQCVQAKVSPFI